MNKEIKDILECLEKYGQLTPDAIDDLHYIRDYITNLQESEAYYYGYYISYKQRIDKAIEYIKVGACYDEEDKYFCDYLSSFELIELLEILEDKDE